MARNAITNTGKAARIEGIPELKAEFTRIVDTLDCQRLPRTSAENIKKVFMRGAMVLVREAKDLAPYDPGRKKGVHLRDAIFASYGNPKKSSVFVSVNQRKAPHAHWLEFGNSRMAAQPYMRPALNATRAAIANIVADGLGDVVEELKK